MKTVVKLFQPRFAPLVKAGAKRQTIRKVPKRERDMPMVGDAISCREWSGRPYVSKQRVLCEGTITGVDKVKLNMLGVSIDGSLPLNHDRENAFAIADGFDSYPEMEAWFEETHGLPFTGILLTWQPQ